MKANPITKPLGLRYAVARQYRFPLVSSICYPRTTAPWVALLLLAATLAVLSPAYVGAAICDSNASPRTGKVGTKVTFSTAYDACRGGEYGWTLTSPSGYTETANTQFWAKTLNEPGTWQWGNVSHVSGCEQCSNDGTIVIDGAACGVTVVPNVPTEIYYDLDVPFRVEATLSGPGSCKSGEISYLWQFGDAAGQTSIFQNVNFKYGTKGTFNWSVTATGNGATNTATGTIKTSDEDCILARLDGQECPFDITVTPLGGSPPAFEFSIPGLSEKERKLCSSTGEDNTYWNFGDGQTSAGLDNKKPDVDGRHEYPLDGEYVIRAVYQIAETTRSHECWKETSLTVGAGGGGGGGGADLPNLLPYKPGTWMDRIVVSNLKDTVTDAALLYDDENLFVDWAVVNASKKDIAGEFFSALYVDGQLKATWRTLSLQQGYYTYVHDHALGALAAGLHTLELVTDSGDRVSESLESDNTYTKAFQVYARSREKPNLSLYQPAGWGNKVVVTNDKASLEDAFLVDSTDNIYVSFALRNTGMVATNSPFYISLKLDGYLIKKWVYKKPVQPNKGYVYVKHANIGKIADGDEHKLLLSVDSDNSISETNEYDNDMERGITVDGLVYQRDLPDLAPAPGRSPIEVKPAAIPGTEWIYGSDQRLKVRIAFSNIGKGFLDKPYTVSLYLDSVLRKSWTVKKKRPGSTFTSPRYALGKLSPGEHVITVIADPAGAIMEEREDNNTYHHSIIVQEKI